MFRRINKWLTTKIDKAVDAQINRHLTTFLDGQYQKEKIHNIVYGMDLVEMVSGETQFNNVNGYRYTLYTRRPKISEHHFAALMENYQANKDKAEALERLTRATKVSEEKTTTVEVSIADLEQLLDKK